MIYQVPTEWTKIILEKDIWYKIKNIEGWCHANIGIGKTISYTYFSPGDVYSVDTMNIEHPLWILERDLNLVIISFLKKEHAFWFVLRWL